MILFPSACGWVDGTPTVAISQHLGRVFLGAVFGLGPSPAWLWKAHQFHGRYVLKAAVIKTSGLSLASTVLYKSRVTVTRGHGSLACFHLAGVLNYLKWIYSSLSDPCTLTPANENYSFVQGWNLEFTWSETEGISLWKHLLNFKNVRLPCLYLSGFNRSTFHFQKRALDVLAKDSKLAPKDAAT